MNAMSPALPGILAGLIRERGPGLLGERRRILGLLRDRAPGEVRAIRILMTAFDGGIPGRLSGTEPTAPDISREGGLLSAETGLAPEVARQAVETWAVALCGYVPTAGASIDGVQRPQVRKLPPRPRVASGADTAETAETVQPQPAWVRFWPAFVLGVAVVGGGLYGLISQPAEGPQPQPPPAQPAPAEPGTPGGGASTRTPEGFPIVSNQKPFPSFEAMRIKNNPNTIEVVFGASIGGQPITYYVAFVFGKGQRQGRGLVGVLQGDKSDDGKVITANRVTESSSGKTYLSIDGSPPQKPGLCIFVQVADSLDRLEIVPGGTLAVFQLDDEGACDSQKRIGLGTLK